MGGGGDRNAQYIPLKVDDLLHVLLLFSDWKMMKNVVGLVTGGASGLGRATVER